MKHKSSITKPAYTEIKVTKITCDLCSCTIIKTSDSAQEIKVSHKSGWSYPDCGAGDLTEFDVCSQCFKEKLIPWFKSQSAEPQVSEWDY